VQRRHNVHPVRLTSLAAAAAAASIRLQRHSLAYAYSYTERLQHACLVTAAAEP
jgi:hypothetical protein